MLISLIITTYNRPDALEAVLRSLDDQTDKNFEVIVGDDGSGPETKKMLEFTHNHKIMAAICETGHREYNNVYCYPVDHPDFWTSKVFSQLLDNKLKGKGWVYVLSWYNCDYNLDDKGFFYIPFKG